jgi:F0F1-type ATP synthase epsilon subunit
MALDRRKEDAKIDELKIEVSEGFDEINEKLTQILVNQAVVNTRLENNDREIKQLKNNQRSVVGAILLSFLADIGGIVYKGQQ